MNDAEFANFLAVCHKELAFKQAAFQQRLFFGKRWFYDLSNCVMTVDSDPLHITPIGTFSAPYETWLWAWANTDFPVLARMKAKAVQGLGDLTDFDVFRTPSIPANPKQVDDLVALAVHELGGVGFFRLPSEDPLEPTLFLSIDT